MNSSSEQDPRATRERVELVRWISRMGAASDQAIARRERITLASARARLTGAQRSGWLARRRPLYGQPSLYFATAAGMNAAGESGLGRCRVSAANAAHLIACAHVAAELESRFREYIVRSERELRRAEQELGVPLASARIGRASAERSWHRPDLVLWPRGPRAGLPVAVEVELTVKAPARLVEICRGWARARCVAGVLYLASPAVERPLRRASERARSGGKVVVVPLCALSPTRDGDSVHSSRASQTAAHSPRSSVD
jgi:hypothetical protein